MPRSARRRSYVDVFVAGQRSVLVSCRNSLSVSTRNTVAEAGNVVVGEGVSEQERAGWGAPPVAVVGLVRLDTGQLCPTVRFRQVSVPMTPVPLPSMTANASCETTELGTCAAPSVITRLVDNFLTEHGGCVRTSHLRTRIRHRCPASQTPETGRAGRPATVSSTCHLQYPADARTEGAQREIGGGAYRHVVRGRCAPCLARAFERMSEIGGELAGLRDPATRRVESLAQGSNRCGGARVWGQVS